MRNSLRRKFQGLGIGITLCFLGYGSYQARLENQAEYEANQQQITQNKTPTNEGEDTLVAQWLKSQSGTNTLNQVKTNPQGADSLSTNVTAKYDASLALKKTNATTVVSKEAKTTAPDVADKTTTQTTAKTAVNTSEDEPKKQTEVVVSAPVSKPTSEPTLPSPEAEPETPEERKAEFPLLVNVGGVYLEITDNATTDAKAVHIEKSAAETSNIRCLFTLTETVSTLWDSKNWSNQTVVALLEKDGTSTGYQILDSVKATKSQPNATFPALKMDVETYKTKGITDGDTLRETVLLSCTTDKETTYWVAARLAADSESEEAPATENSASES